MTDEPKNLHEMLEQATAPGGDMPADLDAETALLRKGWIGLAKLLEADLCPAAPNVEKQVELPVGDRVEAAKSAPRRKAAFPSFRLVAVIAASLLIVAGTAFAIRLLNETDQHQPGRQQIAKDNSPAAKVAPNQATVPATKAVASGSSAQQVAATTDRLQWGDSVDDDITAVGRQTTLAQQDWYSQSGAVGVIQSGIDDLQKEMDQGSL